MDPSGPPERVTVMRLIGVASIALVLALTLTSVSARQDSHQRLDGREIFRFDTFGDEQLWTDVLRLRSVEPSVRWTHCRNPEGGC